MPFCPNCHVEYRSDFSRCSDCDVDLVPVLPAEVSSQPEAAPVELVALAAFPNASEAEMIQELLEDNGISTVLRGEVDPLGNAEGNAGITLLVNGADLAEAERLYEAYFAGEVEGEPQLSQEEEGEDPEQSPSNDVPDRS